MATKDQKRVDKENVERINRWLHAHYKVGDYVVEDEFPSVLQITKIYDAHIQREGLFQNYYVYGAVIETKNLEGSGSYDIKLPYHELQTAAYWNNSYCRYRVISKAEAMDLLSRKLGWAQERVSLKASRDSSMEQIAASRRKQIEEESRSVSDVALNNFIESLKKFNR